MTSSAGASFATIVVNGVERKVPAASTLLEVIATLELAGRRIAVERNGEIVPRSRYADTELASGDRLEIVAAVGGG